MSARPVTVLMIILVLVADAIQFALLLAMKQLAPLLGAVVSAGDLAGAWAALPAIAASPYLWLAALAMACSFVIWMTVLAQLDLSVAFPLGSVSFLVVPLLSSLVLHEHVPPLRWAGFGLVAVGIVALSIGAKRSGEPS